jgi:dihydropteroate synthase
MRCQCFICSAHGDVDAFQIKFHVSQAEYVNAEALINPTWTGTKEPMLKRFSQSWSELRQRTLNPRLILRTKLLQATERALAADVRAEQLIWDPGLGFAKTTAQNLTLLRGLAELRAEGFPLLVGPSRKRFIGAVLAEPRPRARLWGTTAVCGQAIAAGAAILRVHDVGPVVQTARMVDALCRPQQAAPAWG